MAAVLAARFRPVGTHRICRFHLGHNNSPSLGPGLVGNHRARISSFGSPASVPCLTLEYFHFAVCLGCCFRRVFHFHACRHHRAPPFGYTGAGRDPTQADQAADSSTCLRPAPSPSTHLGTQSRQPPRHFVLHFSPGPDTTFPIRNLMVGV